VDAKFARAPDRRRHGDRRQRFRLERQSGAAPDVAIGIRVDHGLQRLAERAEGIRALLDGLAAEHLAAQFQSLVVQVARVHHFSPFPRTNERRLSLSGLTRQSIDRSTLFDGPNRPWDCLKVAYGNQPSR